VEQDATIRPIIIHQSTNNVSGLRLAKAKDITIPNTKRPALTVAAILINSIILV
jgi:hypothetical protein